MRQSNLTEQSLAQSIAPLLMLPGAPDVQVFGPSLLALLQTEGVTIEELRAAVTSALKTESYWPAPALLLQRITRAREQAYKAREQAVLDGRAHEAAQRRALPASDDASHYYDVPEGYPWKVGPPPDPKAPMASGPVLLPDGTPDPNWPELPGRQGANRRKFLYDQGHCSWEYASALTYAEAAAAPSILTDTPRGGGPRKLL